MTVQTMRERLTVPVLGILGLTGGAAAVAYGFKPDSIAHTPDFSLLLGQPAVLQAHVLAAITAFTLGVAMFASRKGARFHRAAGWVWVILMAVVAGSSLAITAINPGHFSLIHLLSALTLLTLPLAVIAARRHRVADHRRRMTGLFLGGMIFAGAFTFLPGRLMWMIFFR
ncbi:MAG: hypothetical protein JWP35_3283 [Caulobacter sp.]|nr:hypothetical protein [Caulobacter sp.]